MIDLAVKLDGFVARAAAWQNTAAKIVVRNQPVDLPKWVQSHFSRGWRSQVVNASLFNKVLSAMDLNGYVVGFACYDVPRLGYFGPLGVAESMRGHGIGVGLTIAALAEMEKAGYGFAMIHHVGPVEFYAKFLKFTLVKT